MCRIVEQYKIKYPNEIFKNELTKGENNPNYKGNYNYCRCGKKIRKTSKTCCKCKNFLGINNPFYGKKHSQVTKNKMKEGQSKRDKSTYKFGVANVELVIERQKKYWSLKSYEEKILHLQNFIQAGNLEKLK
jgi:hypothetical protein